MADDKSLQQLLTDINAAGTACMTGEPGARARLITQLSTAQRELEGPGLYQLRVRLTVRGYVQADVRGLVVDIITASRQHLPAHSH